MEYDTFLKPCDPSTFSGHRKGQDSFRNALQAFKSSKAPVNGFILTGNPGTGKSSLMKVFMDIAKSEMGFQVHKMPILMGEDIGNILERIDKIISPTRIEKKKGFLRKKSKGFNPIDKIQPGGSYEKQLVMFKERFSEIEGFDKKTSGIFFFDECQVMMDAGYSNVVMLLIELMEFLAKKIPFSFVLVLPKSRWKQLSGEVKTLLPLYEVDKFQDVKEAERLLRDHGDRQLMTNRDFRQDLAQKVDRAPYNLIFAAKVVSWNYNKLRSQLTDKNARVDLQKVMKHSLTLISEFNYFDFLVELKNLTDEENAAVSNLLDQKNNYFSLDDLITQNIASKKTLENLVKKGLLTKQDKFYRFVSNTFYEKVGRKTEIDALIQVDMLLSLMSTDLQMGFKPDLTLVNRLYKLVNNTKGENEIATGIAAKSEEIFQKSLDEENYYTAFLFAKITAKLYEVAGSVDSKGKFLEDAALLFKNTAKKPVYARTLFEEAMESFRDIKYRRNNYANKAASIYVELMKEAEKKDQIGLVRTYGYRALKLFLEAEDRSKATNIVSLILKTYPPGSKGGDFFERLLEDYQVEEITEES
ncbi:MAG: hypothetical protein ACXAEU_06595 [Candidatus Hodarchaeales archaeon]|jgi:energy-coupling factor transporter ATP-binding protein EcfA2